MSLIPNARQMSCQATKKPTMSAAEASRRRSCGFMGLPPRWSACRKLGHTSPEGGGRLARPRAGGAGWGVLKRIDLEDLAVSPHPTTSLRSVVDLPFQGRYEIELAVGSWACLRGGARAEDELAQALGEGCELGVVRHRNGARP